MCQADGKEARAVPGLVPHRLPSSWQRVKIKLPGTCEVLHGRKTVRKVIKGHETVKQLDHRNTLYKSLP